MAWLVVVRGIVFDMMCALLAPATIRCAGTACGGTLASAIGGPFGGPAVGLAGT